MQRNTNTVSDQVKSFKQVFSKLSTKASKNLYNWADNLFYDRKISDAVLHTLKAIISCGAMDRPTIQQINNVRTRSAALNFACSNPVTDRTIRRHIETLEGLELIEVTRTRDERRNSRNAYKVKGPEPDVSRPSEDIMGASLTLATSQDINNNKTQFPKLKKSDKVGLFFNAAQLAILATMLSWKTSRFVAVGWIRKYTEDELQGGIQYMNDKNIDHDNRGGYMRRILQGLDERKAEIKSQPRRKYAIPDAQSTCSILTEISNYKRSSKETAMAAIAKLKEAINK